MVSLTSAWLEPAHCPYAPAVQSVLEVALCVAPAAETCPAASVWVRQPVPVHIAVSSTRFAPATPPVMASQPPAAAQLAEAMPCTFGPPVVSVLAYAWVAHPAAVLLAQATDTAALVEA
jgi:hypothetical protein